MTNRNKSTIATASNKRKKDSRTDFWFSDDLDLWLGKTDKKKVDNRRTEWGYKFLPLEREIEEHGCPL